MRLVTTTHQTVTSSDLSRHSAQVFSAADVGAVEITRRDGESLLLLRKSEMDMQQRALHLAADLIAASLDPADTPFVDRLADRLPWMAFLAPDERAQAAADIVAVARACFASGGGFARLLQEVRDWQRTALAKAAGFTAQDALDWLDEPAPAANPHLS